MLRKTLLIVGVLLVVGDLLIWLGFGAPAGLGMAIAGGVLLLALMIERHRYKRILDAPPGPDWQPTGERFFEPGDGAEVAVYFHLATGRRSYVRMHSDTGATAG